MSNELASEALEWCKKNDGGRLCVWWPAGSTPGDGSQPILAIRWDGGGLDEIGVFYDEADSVKAQFICDVFNDALERLAPSDVDYFGTRAYRANGVKE
ncbi:hypothetical protein O4273_26580 [Rhodococcus ruber]|uniref:hypothetical protein n=1 Tax=Rhodococcus ruber TaxID=1830 RepID=UPI0022B3B239|nr:hypothetical protein [Rhodococcus ruber]MCZ4506396.1 hypothetical protein [Rhodococcus ruber]